MSPEFITGSSRFTFSGVAVVAGVLVICTTGTAPEPVLCVVPVAGLRCTNAPTAKPLISPERAKSRMAPVAIFAFASLIWLGFCGIEFASYNTLFPVFALLISLASVAHHSTQWDHLCFNERAIARFGPHLVGFC